MTDDEENALRRNLRQRMSAFRPPYHAESLARAAGLNRNAVRDILSGKSRNPRIDTLRRLARALVCEPNDLITAGIGLNEILVMPHHATGPRHVIEPQENGHWPRTLPVFQTATAGQDAIMILEGVELTHRPPALRAVPDAYALLLPDDSLAPRYFAGEIVWIDPHGRPYAGQYVCARLRAESNQRILGQLVSAGAKEIVLLKHQPSREISVARRRIRSLELIVLGGLL